MLRSRSRVKEINSSLIRLRIRVRVSRKRNGRDNSFRYGRQ